jgi:hypothetical protein
MQLKGIYIMNKFETAKERLITSAQRIAGDYIFHKYGSAHLVGDPKVELTSTEGPTGSSFVFNGSISVVAASDGILNQVGVNMTVNENNIEVEGETSVESKIEQALNAAENQSETVVASLDGFKLENNGSKYLQVKHAALAEATIGVVGQAEYEASKDKVSLLKSVVKDAFPQTSIKFEGSFVEPVIEKIAAHEHEYQKGEHGSVVTCPCGAFKFTEDYLKENPPVVEQPVQPKESWLTDVNANEPEVLMCPECETPNQFGELCQRCLNEQEERAAEGRQPEASKVYSIKENMPRASMTDHLAQLLQLEDQKVASANDKIKTEAVNALVSMLQSMGHGSVKVAEVSDKCWMCHENKATERSGGHSICHECAKERELSTVPIKSSLDVMITVDDAGTIKAVNIPVEIKADKVVLPKKVLVSELISKGLDINAKLSESFAQEVLNKIAAIEEKVAYETKEAEDIIAEKLTKTAGDEPKTQFEGTNETVYLNKHLIPADVENLDIGNVVHVDGVSYKLVSKSKDQLSKGEDDASTWVFEKVQPVAKDTPKKEINK